MTLLTPSISGLADAALVALRLHDVCGRFAAAALIDDDDTVIDLHPYVGCDACLFCAIERAIRTADDWQSADRIVLFSGDRRTSEPAREDDIRIFQQLRREVEQYDLELFDWIQTDGDLIRSLTFTCDAEPAWDRP